MHSTLILPASFAVLAALVAADPTAIDAHFAGLQRRQALVNLFGGNTGAGGGGFLCSATLGLLCSGGGAAPAPVAQPAQPYYGGGGYYGGGQVNQQSNTNIINNQQTIIQQQQTNNYYPVQQGYPDPYWQSSGCGCDGYAYSSPGQGLPAGYPAGFQYYGTKTGWAPPQNWKFPQHNYVAPQVAAKSFAKAQKWWSPAQSQQKWTMKPADTPASWATNGTAPHDVKAAGASAKAAQHRRRASNAGSLGN